MPFQFGANPDRQTAGDLVVSVFEDFRKKFEEVKYGEFLYTEVIPPQSTDTSVSPGATELSYGVVDWRGKGEFRALQDQDIPTVQMNFGKNRIPIQDSSISGKFSREDARRIQFGYDMRLLDEFPRYMRQGCDRHIEGTVFYGNANLNYLGFLAYTGVAVNTVVNNAAATSTLWVDKTSDEIVFDVNNAITTVWENTKHVHLPGTVWLPGSQYGLISSLRMSTAADKTVLQYLKTNNVYTAKTGKELNIQPLRYLDQAGAANADRMIVADMDPDNFIWPWPIPFSLIEPQHVGLDALLFAEYKFGSFHIKRPGCMSYNDGI